MRQALIFAALALIIGLLVACGSPATIAPSTPTAPAATHAAPSPPAGTSAPVFAVASPTPACNPAGFNSVSFVSTTQGWAAGSCGIFTTSDGGAHWRLQYAVPGGAGPVQFLDANTGFALSSLAFSSTVDGGTTWSAPETPEGQPSAFDMISDTAGWAIGRHERTDTSSQLFRVSIVEENGQRPAMYSNPIVSPAESVCFGDPQHGWVANEQGVQRTTDGGATWTLSFRNSLASTGDGRWLPVLGCYGSDVAYALYADGIAAGNEAYALFRTVDAGATWRPVLREGMGPRVDATIAAGSYPGPFDVIDATHAVFVAQCPPCEQAQSTVEITADAGLTWRQSANIPAPYPLGGPSSVEFIDPMHGWLATGDGIHATSDGGETWMRQSP